MADVNEAVARIESNSQLIQGSSVSGCEETFEEYLRKARLLNRSSWDTDSETDEHLFDLDKGSCISKSETKQDSTIFGEQMRISVGPDIESQSGYETDENMPELVSSDESDSEDIISDVPIYLHPYPRKPLNDMTNSY